MWELARISIEIVSAAVCVFLVWFMIKPYRLTGQARYIGLPLGFGFLGASYAISAVAYSEGFCCTESLWLQSLTRSFAFVFLAVTYYFSTKPAKSHRLFWDLTFSMLIVVLIALFPLGVVSPQVASISYTDGQLYVRTFNILCLAYVAAHTIRSHIREPNPATLWIPFGFILFAVSQYSLLFWYIDASFAAFWGSIGIRLAALAVFLFVAIKTFCTKKDESY